MPPDSVQGPTDADYIAEELDAQKVFVIDDQTSYSTGIAETLIEALREQGVQTSRDSVNQDWYDTAMATMEIARDAGITSETPLEEAREAIRAGWAGLEDYEGVSGTTSIDEEGEGLKEVFVFEIEDGEWVKVSSAAPAAEG